MSPNMFKRLFCCSAAKDDYLPPPRPHHSPPPPPLTTHKPHHRHSLPPQLLPRHPSPATTSPPPPSPPPPHSSNFFEGNGSWRESDTIKRIQAGPWAEQKGPSHRRPCLPAPPPPLPPPPPLYPHPPPSPPLLPNSAPHDLFTRQRESVPEMQARHHWARLNHDNASWVTVVPGEPRPRSPFRLPLEWPFPQKPSYKAPPKGYQPMYEFPWNTHRIPPPPPPLIPGSILF